MASGQPIQVIDAPADDINHPDALALRGSDMFIAGYNSNAITEVSAATGALTRVIDTFRR